MDNALAEMIRRAKALSDALVRYRVMEGSIAEIEQAWADLEAIRPAVLEAVMRPQGATESDSEPDSGSEPSRVAPSRGGYAGSAPRTSPRRPTTPGAGTPAR